uniref:Uncharacterized protein n=1 Tax=Parascaris univalens TaxID=6257 RepID=A0A915BSR5_PARUN
MEWQLANTKRYFVLIFSMTDIVSTILMFAVYIFEECKVIDASQPLLKCTEDDRSYCLPQLIFHEQTCSFRCRLR